MDALLLNIAATTLSSMSIALLAWGCWLALSATLRGWTADGAERA
jgi:hypothetical protein